MVGKKLDAPCYACGAAGNYSVLLAQTHGRLHLPNQIVRGSVPPHPGYGEVTFCADCMRAVEDALRATVLYLQTEHQVVPPTDP